MFKKLEKILAIFIATICLAKGFTFGLCAIILLELITGKAATQQNKR
jgi:hypothetical protein